MSCTISYSAYQVMTREYHVRTLSPLVLFRILHRRMGRERARAERLEFWHSLCSHARHDQEIYTTTITPAYREPHAR